jgi:hypothetical protein
MRTDVSLGNTLFIATLDKISHTLRIEDVWVWKGKTVYTEETFSRRRTYLKEFVESLWVPDARLMGGIQTTIANPKPLSHLLSLTPESPVFSIDLIPELPGRRRFTFSPGAPPAQAPKPLPTPTILQKRDVTPIQTTKRVFATAVRLDALPDVYDLLTRDGTPLCRAAVQQLALSQELRKYKGSEIPVVAEWKAEFVNDTCLADSDDDDGVADGLSHHHGGNDDVPCSQYPITIGGLMESYADLTPGGACTHTHAQTRTFHPYPCSACPAEM